MTSKPHGAGGISIHAVDVARGVPAAGLGIVLRRIDPDDGIIAQGHCAENGHFVHSVSDGFGVTSGVYEVTFKVAAFYQASDLPLPDPPFLTEPVFRFGIDRVSEHFHLPFKFTPWGFSLFRGGA
ncbi:hydroxyisourate hydrolase [Tropicimonas sp. S265A]|uniref:hydroxyisourate hydrolase n=1 Tax=Tropicimonas sp. S265A TaxID=3415134 RepID=UPI003C7D3577